MQIRVQSDKTTVRVLFSHEMERGQRRDAAGRPIAARFIQSTRAMQKGRVVLSAQWGPAVSRNPFLQFGFNGGKPGDKLALSWIYIRSDEVAIG
ncbi:thiosulfate oxidation carrier complex protein SoxZ [Pseudorhodoferax sp. Leaf265]|nr:thiosulfate oxidation carrier complex protein SoxZ [Pseudorhodoferax sp. Leaf265]